MAKIKFVGDGPNDPTAVIIQNAYAIGRGKYTPPALPSWQGPGGMGQVHDKSASDNGRKLLDEALK